MNSSEIRQLSHPDRMELSNGLDRLCVFQSGITCQNKHTAVTHTNFFFFTQMNPF